MVNTEHVAVDGVQCSAVKLKESRYGFRGVRVGEASHPGPRLGNRVESRRDAGLSIGDRGHIRGGYSGMAGVHCPLSLTVLTGVWWVSVVVFGEGVSPNVAVCQRTF